MSEQSKSPNIVSILLQNDGTLTPEAQAGILEALDTNNDGTLSHLEITAGILNGVNALKQEGVTTKNPLMKGLSAGALTAIAGLADPQKIPQHVLFLARLAPKLKIEAPDDRDAAYIHSVARDAALEVVDSTSVPSITASPVPRPLVPTMPMKPLIPGPELLEPAPHRPRPVDPFDFPLPAPAPTPRGCVPSPTNNNISI